MQKVELAPDSGGPGRHRGGLGLDLVFEHLEACYATSFMERTQSKPWGLEGGLAGRVHSLLLTRPDGSKRSLTKDTAVFVEKGATLELRSCGGGGFGRPADRDVEAIRHDIREGYVTAQHAAKHYPQAFD
jgi:N-methylhydantoinase B